MPKLGGLLDDAVTSQPLRPSGHLSAHLDHIVDVALGVRATRDRKADELHGRGGLRSIGVAPEHDGADLAASYAAGLVERDDERLSRVAERRHVGEQSPRIDVDRVTAHRLDDRDARLFDPFAEIGGGANAVIQVVVADRLFEPLGDRLQVAACEPESPAFSGRTLYALSAFTRFVNGLGLAAVALPCGFDENGMPIAAQLVGPAGSDLSLLSLAADIQSDSDWHALRPAALDSLLEAGR